jgi:diaminohydroxyphosphoribosylaminopyrimidine deaminase/5-amino-6-(5-phosphoribosylamino)uracil reductase
MNQQELYMQRCIELAKLGAGNTRTNPMVGCVIVHQNKIIGEGWHQQYGGPHAEVNAIGAVANHEWLEDAELYVSLEPCAHHGKTPPCVDLIIEKKIKKVVIGMADPFDQVAGRGIQKLREHNVDVTIGVLEQNCKELNKRFIHYHTAKRPYIILKWAQTQDGFIAPDINHCTPEEFEEKRHITGRIVQQLVHKWRSQEAAIMVGTNTVLTDNPALNNRAWPGNAPVRVIIDRYERLLQFPHLKVFDGSQPTLLFTSNHAYEKFASTVYINLLDLSKPMWEQIVDVLYQKQIVSLIVEGGNQLLTHLINHHHWDEAQVFTTPAFLQNGILAPQINGMLPKESHRVDGVQLHIYRNNT